MEPVPPYYLPFVPPQTNILNIVITDKVLLEDLMALQYINKMSTSDKFISL